MTFFTHTLVVIFFTFALLLSFIDIKHQKIPRFLSFSFMGVIYGLRIFEALLISLNFSSSLISNLPKSSQKDFTLVVSQFLSSLLSPTLGFILGLVVFFAVRFITKKKLGLADVWFSASMGIFLGFFAWYLALTVACFLAFFWILSLAILRKIRSKRAGIKIKSIRNTFRHIKIPFIPFLTAGALCALLISSI